jgi:hypothetical protein
VQGVVTALRAACDEVEQGAHSAQRAVQTSRRAIQTALTAHGEACKTFDAAVGERKRPGGKVRGVESDPWVTEGRLVEAQAALQRHQSQQRAYLAAAFQRVGDLELRRVQEVTGAVSKCVAAYRATVVAVAHQAERLMRLVEGVDGVADLEAFVNVAVSSVASGDALNVRQAEMVDHLWRELLTSAEVRSYKVQYYSACFMWYLTHSLLVFQTYSIDTGGASRRVGAAAAHGRHPLGTRLCRAHSRRLHALVCSPQGRPPRALGPRWRSHRHIQSFQIHV